MAKRTKNSEGTPSKRAKIEDIDDLWGDDLDESVIDDCFQLATQVIEQVSTSLHTVEIEGNTMLLLEEHHMYAAKQCFYFTFLQRV